MYLIIEFQSTANLTHPSGLGINKMISANKELDERFAVVVFIQIMFPN